MNTVNEVVWVGLGKLGLPMAKRVVEGGFQVRGFDLSAERLSLAETVNIRAFRDLAKAVESCPIVFVSIPDDKALLGLMLGAGELIRHMAPASILVETSTVSIEASAKVAEAAAARGIHYLRCPVSGNPVAAQNGTLSAMVSGPAQAFESVRPVLETFTAVQSWLGEAEQARYAKLAINLMIAVSAGMLAEALAMSRKGGIAWEDMLQLVSNSAVGSPMVKYKTQPLAQRNFNSTFDCTQMAKDLDLILSCTRTAGVSAPLAAQMRETYSSLIAMGHGGDDYIATVHHTETLSGLPAIEAAHDRGDK
jgi:3-hydroxyisobutyrate dehydrogenase-like beta-hydroxyacid dehydrogenase